VNNTKKKVNLKISLFYLKGCQENIKQVATSKRKRNNYWCNRWTCIYLLNCVFNI